jgi:DNA-binding LacI/PurR family transcriptional regulator
VVSLLRDDVGRSVDSVSSDDEAGIREAVDHLAGLGHRHIVYVDGGMAVSADKRREAFSAEVLRRGLEPVTVPGGPTEEDGISAGRSIGALERIEGAVPPAHVVRTPHLVVRRTTAAPPFPDA